MPMPKEYGEDGVYAKAVEEEDEVLNGNRIYAIRSSVVDPDAEEIMAVGATIGGVKKR